jgi:hypothetical protein
VKHKSCATCDAWVAGGLCRRLRVNEDGTLFVAPWLTHPNRSDQQYVTGVCSTFCCLHHRPAAGFAIPAPSGFFFGTPWNVMLGGEVLLLHIPDECREDLFALCDRLNLEYERLTLGKR